MNKKLFRFEDYTKDKGEYVMHCKTREEAEEFCKLMHKNGREWRDGRSYLEDNHWSEYKEYTCYRFNNGYFLTKQWYSDWGFIVLEWSDFRKENNYE